MQKAFIGFQFATAAMATLIFVGSLIVYARGREALTLAIVVPSAIAATVLVASSYYLFKGQIQPGLSIANKAILLIASVFALVALYTFARAFGGKSPAEVLTDIFQGLFHDPMSFVVVGFPIFSLVTFVLSFFVTRKI